MAIEITAAARLELPYRAIGLIETTWSDGSRSIGTCTLVGRNDVLTAGHCVFDPDKGGYASSYKFYFGADYNTVTNTFEDHGYQVTDLDVEVLAWPGLTYLNSDNATLTMPEAQYDIALIGLKTPAGDQQGYFEMAPGFDTGLSSENIAVKAIGYANGSTGLMQDALIVSHSDYLNLYNSYVASLGPGSSGGPLLYQVAGLHHVLVGVKTTVSWWADVGGLYEELLAGMIKNDALIVDRLAPSVLAFRPDQGTSLILPNTDLSIQFTELVQAGSGVLLLKTQGITQQSILITDDAQVRLSGDTLQIDFAQSLAPNTMYEIILPTGYVKDLAGNALSLSSVTFSTRSVGERLEFQIANEQLAMNFNTIQDVSAQVSFAANLQQGSQAHDVLLGSDRADYILAYGGDDVIHAGFGNDRIYPGAGDDSGSGDDGIDTLVYACYFSEALIEPGIQSDGSLSVTVSEKMAFGIGQDIFTGIERLEFADYGLAIDLDEANQAGGIYRLYQAAFDRVPDLPGLGYWIEQADFGKTAVRMGEDFIWSDEFQSVYQVNITDNYTTGANVENLVKGFYQNVLGRQPDMAGMNYYTGVIQSQEKTVGRVLAEIADSPENRDLVADDIINGILYRPYAQNVESFSVPYLEESVSLSSWKPDLDYFWWGI